MIPQHPVAEAVDAEAEAGAASVGVRGIDRGAGEGIELRQVQAAPALPGSGRRIADVEDAGEHRAARHLGDQRRRAARRLGAELRVRAALETVAGVGVHAEPLGRHPHPAAGRSGRSR